MDDILALLAIGAASSKDVDMAAELCDYSAEVLDPDSENEWLYGRGGYLYLLRLVKASFVDDEKTTKLLNDTAADVVDAILDSPRPWKWHGKAYVGAVHGAFGIITQLIMTDAHYAKEVEADLAAWLSYQFESGNWPSSIPPGKDRLVQVCHGAPGVINCLESIKEHFPKLKDRIDKAISKGRECVWERGLLTKESCLCHGKIFRVRRNVFHSRLTIRPRTGISGNALALEDEQCAHFLSYTTGHEMKSLEKDGMMERSEDPEALWCGEAGRAWAWAVMDKGLPKRLLGFNDI